MMDAQLGQGQRRAILALIATIVIIVVMDITIINVALHSIEADLAASNAGLQWVLNSYLITFAAFLFTAGVCADRFGRQKTLLAGLAVFGIGSLVGAYAGSTQALIVWRGVMGIGAAVIPTVTLAVIMNVFPPPERPKAVAVWAGAAGAAFAIGPVVGGGLLEEFWWGSVFLVNVPLVIASLVLVRLLVPESSNPDNSRFDPLGVLLSIVAVGALVYGIVLGGENDEWLTLRTLGPIAVGLVLLGALVVVERRVPSPSLDVGLLRNARFAAGTASIALCFGALVSAIFVVQFYYQAVLGFSPLKSGMMLVPMGIGSTFMSSRCPRLVPKVGAGVVVAAGSTTMAISFVVTSQLGASTSTWVLLVAQLGLGLGWGCIMAPATSALMSVVPPAKAGAGQAVSQTGRQVSGALGVAVIGSILGVVYRSSIGDAVNVLPADLRDEAGGSIGGTMRSIQAARLAPEDAAGLVGEAADAYLSGMQVTMIVTAVAGVLATVVALRWLPRRSPQGASPVAAEPVPDGLRHRSGAAPALEG